jgi:hypothetical protein
MSESENSPSTIRECVAAGRAVADVIGDPFGSAEDYAALDRGDFVQMIPEEAGLADYLAEDLATILRFELFSRFTGDAQRDAETLAAINARRKAASAARKAKKQST